MEKHAIYQKVKELVKYDVTKTVLRKDFYYYGCNSYGTLYDDTTHIEAFAINKNGEARKIDVIEKSPDCQNADGSINYSIRTDYELIMKKLNEDDVLVLLNITDYYSDNNRDEDNSQTLLMKVNYEEYKNYIVEKEKKQKKEFENWLTE